MDRRKALKTWHFTRNCPPLQLEFYLKVYTSENEKNQVFFQEQMKRF
jgi:hypothetical protein